MGEEGRIEIDEMTEQDLEDVMQIERSSFPTPWSPNLTTRNSGLIKRFIERAAWQGAASTPGRRWPPSFERSVLMAPQMLLLRVVGPARRDPWHLVPDTAQSRSHKFCSKRRKRK